MWRSDDRTRSAASLDRHVLGSCRRGPGHPRLYRSGFGSRGCGLGGVRLGRRERADRARACRRSVTAAPPALAPPLGDGRGCGPVERQVLVGCGHRRLDATLWAVGGPLLLTGPPRGSCVSRRALLMASLSFGQRGRTGLRASVAAWLCRVRELDAAGGGLRRLARSPSLACTGGPGCDARPVRARCSGHPHLRPASSNPLHTVRFVWAGLDSGPRGCGPPLGCCAEVGPC